MQIIENHPLKNLNTFGIDVKARYFTEMTSDEEITRLIASGFLTDKNYLILNGGSNILFTRDFDGVVIKIGTKGIQLITENETMALVRASAGENWHNFVLWCIGQNFGGLENLSLIPGNVGAAPIQNIGAYGVEQKDVFESLEAVEAETGRIRHFTRDECRFGYRNSVFKQQLKNRYIILSVTYKLTKEHFFNTGYGDIQRELSEMKDMPLTIKMISDAVCRIRNAKLPDPEKIGNAGSFFKNPTINAADFQSLQEKYPAIPGYPDGKEKYKIPAGWMIDHLGWKGFRHGDAGVCHTQALVLVNYGHAAGQEILEIARAIMESVKQNFGIVLEPEVNIY